MATPHLFPRNPRNLQSECARVASEVGAPIVMTRESRVFSHYWMGGARAAVEVYARAGRKGRRHVFTFLVWREDYCAD